MAGLLDGLRYAARLESEDGLGKRILPLCSSGKKLDSLGIVSNIKVRLCGALPLDYVTR